MKVCIYGQGHMTKMATMAKTFKNLLQNQKGYDFETWHEASGNEALQSSTAEAEGEVRRL